MVPIINILNCFHLPTAFERREFFLKWNTNCYFRQMTWKWKNGYFFNSSSLLKRRFSTSDSTSLRQRSNVVTLTTSIDDVKTWHNDVRSRDVSSTMFFLFLKMGQSRPLFVYFRSFLITISIQIEKKRRWCAWDSNPGPQVSRCRQNHRAMGATLYWVKLHCKLFLTHLATLDFFFHEDVWKAWMLKINFKLN